MKEYVKSLVARESARRLVFGFYVALQHTSSQGLALCCRVVASPRTSVRVVSTAVKNEVFREADAAVSANELFEGS